MCILYFLVVFLGNSSCSNELGSISFFDVFFRCCIADAELWHYFPEMMRLAPQCRFYNCTHVHEPGCAVREAVERGEISWQRYESYLKMLDDDDKYRK